MKKIVYILLLPALLNSCSMNYSFTGSSIAPEVKTASVMYFPSFVANTNPIMSQEFTQALQDKFISQTRLKLVKANGDLNFEGEITEYKLSPSAVQSNETTAQNRLTITVNVRFTNTQDTKQNFETPFTRFADFSSSKNLNEVEDALNKEIIDQIIQDIFNKSVTNW